jgi:hypothetical protein
VRSSVSKMSVSIFPSLSGTVIQMFTTKKYIEDYGLLGCDIS